MHHSQKKLNNWITEYGTWEGSNGNDVIIEANGTLRYGDVAATATYDIEKGILSATGKSADGIVTYTFELKYNSDTKTFSAEVKYVDDETRYARCSSLSKVTE